MLPQKPTARLNSKYPVATRVATERTDYLCNNFSHMLQRVDNDHDILTEKFQIKKLHENYINMNVLEKMRLK